MSGEHHQVRTEGNISSRIEERRQSFASLKKRLLRWYDAHHRQLPWRKSRDPYKIWVSEVMLKNKPLLRKGRHLWVALRGLKNYPFPSGSAKIVKFLEAKEKYFESNE